MTSNTSGNSVRILSQPSSPRISKLCKHFQDVFEEEPSFLVRVPGRVNIIGEHIDYCGYPVFPMALAQDILIAVKEAKDNKIQMTNIDKKYIDFVCPAKDINISSDKPMWYNYGLCGIKGVLDGLDDISVPFLGIRLAISGTLPPAAGLSSSSALVSASVLAVAHCMKLNLNKQKLATIAATSERYIGTQGGGMDQAIAFLARKGCASYIEFNPLTSVTTNLPSDVVFVIAHSLQEANKAANQDFNCRVIECRLAARIIAKRHNLDWAGIMTLKQVADELDKSLAEMILEADKILEKHSYTRQEICTILEISEEEFVNTCLTPKVADILFEFKLRQRALHVYNEARRVVEFRAVCTDLSSLDLDKNSISESISRLGTLLSESHRSLARLYECSHPMLDKMVEISEREGVPARLTGAGWGGCIVAMCERGREQAYIDTLKREYYAKLPEEAVGKLARNVDTLVFSTTPQDGAEIYVPHEEEK